MRWPRFRTQLLLVLALLAALPISAWFAAREIETFMREAEERALVALAQSLSQALRAEDAVPGDGRERLYVQRLDVPQSVDAVADDWAIWGDAGQRFESPSGRVAMRVLLATDNRRLFGLLRVYDATSGSLRSETTAGNDEVLLQLSDGLAYRITPGTAPGAADVSLADSPDIPVAGLVRAAWRDVGTRGYLVEFRIPLSLALPTAALAVRDWGRTGNVPELAGTVSANHLQPWPLLLHSSRWSERLTEATSAGQRSWIVDRTGYIIAVGGELDLSAAGEAAGWRALIYDALRRQPADHGELRDPRALLQLNEPEVRSARSGAATVAWRLDPEGAMVATAAVPLRHNDRAIGALVLESPADGLLLTTNRVLVRTVLTAIGALLVVGLLLGGLASAQSFRIRRLSRAISRVSERGLRDPLPETDARDEVGDLARDFATLLAEQNANNTYLEQLAGRLAHELGTPLAVVRSSLDNIATFATPAEIEPYLRRAQDGADRLRAILRAMSETRRLEHALAVPEFEPVDVAEMVSLMLAGYRELDPDHEWQFERDDADCTVDGAGDLLAQALDKLVDNARGFSPPGGLIKLGVRRDRDQVIIAVANEGPPLPDHMQRRIFESMISVRDDSPSDDARLHLGLGLHVVKVVAHAHRGGARAFNLHDGSGVEFQMWLPAATAG